MAHERSDVAATHAHLHRGRLSGQLRLCDPCPALHNMQTADLNGRVDGQREVRHGVLEVGVEVELRACQSVRGCRELTGMDGGRRPAMQNIQVMPSRAPKE